MPPKFTCIICQIQSTDRKKPEHILLNALGGKMTSTSALCSKCNNWLGAGPDRELAESVASIRNMASLKSGNGKPPPALHLGDDNLRYTLLEGRRAVARPTTPWLESSEGVLLSAPNEEELLKLLSGLAKKHGLNEEQKNKLIDFANKEAVVFEYPVPLETLQLSFGSVGAQRSMLKSCLVLWEKAVGNCELQHSRYDTGRRFVLHSTDESGKSSEGLSWINDTPVGKLNEEFGSHPNIIWVGSNEAGQVFGYFNLYGIAGWGFELCKAGAPAGRSIALVSNPFDNTCWRRFDDAKVGNINFRWVGRLQRTQQSEFLNAQKAIRSFHKLAYEQASEHVELKMIEEAADYVGLNSGDRIEGEIGQAFISEVSRRFTNQILQKPGQRPLKPRRKA
ncbi:MAG: HNH endonuclease [Cognatishimia sp.]